MQRYNIFNNIHKALRAMLYDTALSLQQTDFNNEEEAEMVLEKLSTTKAVFDEHAYHEDKFLMAAIKKYEPSVTTLFEQEYVTDQELSERLEKSLEAFSSYKLSTDREIAGGKLAEDFNEFLVFNLAHMAKEEKLLNDVLWKNFSDKEIHMIECRIIEEVSPQIRQVSTLWMIKGMSTVEISNWLRMIAKNASLRVFESLLTSAENELTQAKYHKLIALLSEAVMTD